MSSRRGSWPRWENESPMVNLRQVAPGLWVGAYMSPQVPPHGVEKWGLIIDLFGRSLQEDTDVLMQRPFEDGWPIPDGVLDDAESLVRASVDLGMPVLIHCAAGVSRSVSVAYAMLRTVYGMDHDEALGRVKVDPNYPRKETLRSAVRWVDGRG